MPGSGGRDRVCVGAIVGAHGVRGQVRIKSFTADPADVAAYGPVGDESGEREFEIEVTGASAGAILARIAGIDDRDRAEALRGTRLYVPRERLPAPDEDEFYHGDLLGLEVVGAGGETVGEVIAVQTVGETDVLEIRLIADGRAVMVPFTRAAVPNVDLDAGRIVVDAAPGLFDPPGPDDREGDGAAREADEYADGER